jgi:peptidoglycan/LPS O-acetylase OafA/YrhL
MPERSHSANRTLECVRGVAALLVLFAHTRSYLFDAEGVNVRGGSPVETLLLAPTSLAKESVAVFFILSGYLVGGQVLRQTVDGRFSWGDYLAKRITRLWPVLVVGVLATALVDGLSEWLFPGAVLGAWSSHAPVVALCNIGFLQIARCETYGSNDALWSISYEFWFYIIFAGLGYMVMSLARRQWSRSLTGAVAVAITLVAFGPQLLTLIPAWLLGAVVAWSAGRYGHQLVTTASANVLRILTACGVVLCALGLAASNVLRPSEPIQFALIGITVAPVVFLVSLTDPAARARRLSPIVTVLAWLGSWSFSIYVFHLPIVRLLALYLASVGRYPGLIGVAVVYLLGAVATVCVYPLWAISEKWTPQMRQLALRAVHTREGSASAAGSAAQRVERPEAVSTDSDDAAMQPSNPAR